MRTDNEVLRLKLEAWLIHEKIAVSTGIFKGAVTNAVQRGSKGPGLVVQAGRNR